jgi:queuine/archaeosine tRNA-ribosyltransferase
LCALHNLRFMHRLLDGARRAILEQRFDAYLASHSAPATG